MAGAQSAIVTGANSGLGLECCRSLLAAGGDWHVVLAVRDPARGAEAVTALGQRDRCTVIPLDLASLESVTEFVSAYQSNGALPRARAVVCNAGLQVISGTRYTSDGIELTFGTNHLGHFALVTGLLDRLSPPARIVVVSSDTHDPSKAVGMPAPVYRSAEELAHPSATATGESEVKVGRRRYTTSKLCNLLFAYELDRRLEQGRNGVTVNAFNPGLMPGSRLARDYGPVQRLAWGFVMPALRVLPQVHSTRESGAVLSALASSSEFDGVTGKYFDGRKPISSSADSYDQVRAQDLWEWSARQIANSGGTDSSLS